LGSEKLTVLPNPFILIKIPDLMEEKHCDVHIIGSGITGLATAMYSARFGLSVVVTGDAEGGMITYTDDVSNYPGFAQITGKELFTNVKEHALSYPVELLAEKIMKVEKKGKEFVSRSETVAIHSKVVIFATGTKHRELGVPGEKEFFGRGVHTCALCDGPFYKNMTVAIIGGSDSAAKEANILAEHAKKVYIIYRGEQIRAEPINLARVQKNEKIEIITNTNITEIQGERVVKKVLLDKEYNGKKELELEGVFIAIGHIALSDLAIELGVELNKKGEIMVNRNSETNVPGVYAAGDVVDTVFKQAITGVAEGVTASFHAYEYIQRLKG